MQLTKNFKLSEFHSKDGTNVPTTMFDSVSELARNLQVIRDTVNKPIKINSGYRSPEHNKTVGGKPNSYHLKAMAADIVVDGLRPSKLASIIKGLMDKGLIKKGGLKAYSTFCHVDIRGYYATW